MKNQAEGITSYREDGEVEDKPDGAKLDNSMKLMGMLGGALV